MVGRKSSLIILLLLFASFLFSSCLIMVPLTFDANGGKFSDGSSVLKMTVGIRSMVSPPEPTRDDGLVFIGWYRDREGREPAGELLSKPVTFDMAFYAKWGYMITFDPKGGTEVEPIKAAPGEPIEPPESQKSGYVLAGWFLDDGTFEQRFDFSEMPAQHLTLYAKWELYNPTLSFELINDGEEYQVSIGQCLDDDIKLPAVYEGKPVTAIPEGGFDNSGSLSTITISESISSIAPNAFEHSPNLVSITVHPDNPYYISQDGTLYKVSEEGAVLIRYCPGRLDTCFAVPDKVYAIGEELTVIEVIQGAFNDCKDLLMIVIPRGVSTMSGPLVNENVKKAVFVSEAPSRPEGWAEDWLGDRPAIMGCEVSADLKRALYFNKGPGSILNLPEAFNFSGLLIGDYLLEGWYVYEDGMEIKVDDLLSVPDGTDLYARWLRKNRADVLQPLWEQVEYIFSDMFGEVGPYFVELKSKQIDEIDEIEVTIGRALLASEPGYPVLAFECKSLYYDEVLSQVAANNEYPVSYTRISGTNIYVADDCSMYYLFTKRIKKVNSSYYSKDGTVLLYAPGANPLELPQKVKGIGDRAFMGIELECLSLQNIESIGTMAFAGAKVSSLELGEGLSTIGRMAFMSIEGLDEVTIPATVAKVGAGAFFGCNSLASINVAEGSEYYISVGGHLYSADGLTLVHCAPAAAGRFIVPEGVEIIAEMALASCGFEEVEIGKGVYEIGTGAFYKTSLKSITVSESNADFKSVDGSLYSKDGTALIKYASAREDELFVIFAEVSAIKSGAFSACGETALKYVVLGSGVTWIEAAAFKDLGAVSAAVPSDVGFIGRQAFCGATLYLEAVELPDCWDTSFAQTNFVVFGCALSQDKSYVESVSWQGEGFSIVPPFRQGYAFAGWYDSPDFSGQGYYDLKGCPEGTYYARWEVVI